MTSRRTILTGAAAGSAKAEPAMSPAFQAVADEFTAAIAEYRAVDDRMTVLLNSLPEDVLYPVWKRTPTTMRDLVRGDLKFTDPDEARSYFDRAISSHQGLIDQFGGDADNALVRGHRAEQDRLRGYRDEAVAHLEEKKAAQKASGISELDELQEAAGDRASEAFTALLEYPCTSLEEIQTKARLLLSAPGGFGSELEYDEAKTLLRSFIGASA